MAIIKGTTGDDYLTGTEAADRIYGLAGDDYLFGDRGNDSLFGDDGDDALDGGAGNDFLDGGRGIDSLRGGDDNDKLYGRVGNDYIYGDSGKDLLSGGLGDDNLDGGDGNDILYGNWGKDYLFGYVGNDILSGNEDNDSLVGWIGSDTLSGGEGDDVLDGGFSGSGYGGGENQIDVLFGRAGLDTFQISYIDDINLVDPGTSDYTLIKDFAPAQDFIQLVGNQSNYYLQTSPTGLSTGTAIYFDQPGTSADELIAVVENSADLSLQASYFTTTDRDAYYGTDFADKFNSGRGDDYLVGRGGKDQLIGGTEDDFVIGGTGNDAVFGSEGNDTLKGVEDQGDSDAIRGLGEIDTLTGGTGKDQLILGEAIGGRYGSSAYVYYDDGNPNTAGVADYAAIADFNASQDVIQLLGTASDYTLSTTSGSLPRGTGIYLNQPGSEPNELIAILPGTTSLALNLDSAYFSYVDPVEGRFGPI